MIPTKDNVVGAALPEQQSDIKPILNGVGEDKVVGVINPLPQDFRVQYARSLVQAAPLSPEGQFAREKAGLVLSKDSRPVAHVAQFLILKAGETKNLPGDIAQTAVRQLTTYIIGVRYAGQRHKPIADPHMRNQVEQEIIVYVKDNTEILNQLNDQDYTNRQLQQLEITNNHVNDTGQEPVPASEDINTKRKPGRPKKTL